MPSGNHNGARGVLTRMGHAHQCAKRTVHAKTSRPTATRRGEEIGGGIALIAVGSSSFAVLPSMAVARTESVRRAHMYALDSTVQPYSVVHEAVMHTQNTSNNSVGRA